MYAIQSVNNDFSWRELCPVGPHEKQKKEISPEPTICLIEMVWKKKNFESHKKKKKKKKNTIGFGERKWIFQCSLSFLLEQQLDQVVFSLN